MRPGVSSVPRRESSLSPFGPREGPEFLARDCRCNDTLYTDRMTTTVSFRADDRVVRALDAEAARSGTTKSELLVQAVKELLYRLACERDAQSYARLPLTPDETTGWSNEQWIDDEPDTDWAKVFAP